MSEAARQFSFRMMLLASASVFVFGPLGPRAPQASGPFLSVAGLSPTCNSPVPAWAAPINATGGNVVVTSTVCGAPTGVTTFCFLAALTNNGWIQASTGGAGVSNLSGGWITSLTNNGVILGLGAAGVLNGPFSSIGSFVNQTNSVVEDGKGGGAVINLGAITTLRNAGTIWGRLK